MRMLWQDAFTIHYNMEGLKNAFKSDKFIANQGPNVNIKRLSIMMTQIQFKITGIT